MRVLIDNPVTLGKLARAVRKAQGLRQDDLAAMVGISHVSLMNVERGKGTVQLGSVLDVLRELGIALHLEVPDEAATRVQAAMREAG